MPPVIHPLQRCVAWHQNAQCLGGDVQMAALKFLAPCFSTAHTFQLQANNGQNKKWSEQKYIKWHQQRIQIQLF